MLHGTDHTLISPTGGRGLPSDRYSSSYRVEDRPSPILSAFGTTGNDALSFLDLTDEFELLERASNRVARNDAVDRGLSRFSHCSDPDGNWLELATSDHRAVSSKSNRRSGPWVPVISPDGGVNPGVHASAGDDPARRREFSTSPMCPRTIRP